MNKLFVAMVSVVLAFPSVRAGDVAKPFSTARAKSPPAPAVADEAEAAYRCLLEADDEAQADVDKWIRDARAFEAAGSGLSTATLHARVKERLGQVRKLYEEFLLAHSDHVRARLAFGSFLKEMGEDAAAVAQWEKARELDPKNPAAWNNLAKHYGEGAAVRKGFEYAEKAFELCPREPVYRHNLALMLYAHQAEAAAYYNVDEVKLMEKVLGLYRQALELAPGDFQLASDHAQAYYGLRSPRWPEAIAAWEQTLKLARDEIERQGVHIHLARCELSRGDPAAARRQLAKVADPLYAPLKVQLTQAIEKREQAGFARIPSATPAPSSTNTSTPP